jgi:hypothetical protein
MLWARNLFIEVDGNKRNSGTREVGEKNEE